MSSHIRASCPVCQDDITEIISNHLVFDLENPLHNDADWYTCKKCKVDLLITVSLKVDTTALAIENTKTLNKLIRDLEQIR